MPELQRNIKTRLMGDIRVIKKNPVAGIHLEFDPVDMQTWYFIIEGSDRTPFKEGFYFGEMVLSANYPFSPPTVCMITPSGRFQLNTNLFSYTNFHPASWSAAVIPSDVALDLVSFMNDINDCGIGCITTSEAEMKKLALESLDFNLKDPIVQSLFPDVVAKMQENKFK